MRNTTLLFLVKRSQEGKITHICLAMKKRGFGVGRWNGTGGKFDEMKDSSVEDTAAREAREEIGISAKIYSKVAVMSFTFPHNTAWSQNVYVYLCDEWEGESMESEEMKPQWFSIADIPYSKMWPDDIFWLPHVIEGKLVKARFTFGEGDVVADQYVEIVPDFETTADELAKKSLKS